MKRLLTAVLLSVALTACALTGTVFGPSPEAQIKTGSDSHKAVTTLGTVLLRNDRITVVQSKSYSTILHAAIKHLDDAAAKLTDCRKKTGSTEKTRPDPCAATVEDDIRLAVSVVGDVQKTLKAKE